MRRRFDGPGLLSLRETPFFRGMEAGLLSRIEQLVYRRNYETHQIVHFPEDPCDLVYWVHSGQVRITRESGDGRALTFRHLAKGDLFGEECLVNPNRHGSYAEATRATVLCLMQSQDFRRIVGEEIGMASRVGTVLCRRALDTEQVLAETVFLGVRERLAAGLLRLYRQTDSNGRSALEITHRELANLVGSTRETTTVLLHGLRDEGVVQLANRRVVVLDPLALEHMARTG